MLCVVLLFIVVVSRKERYLKPTDAKEVLTSYVRAQDLVDKDNNRYVYVHYTCVELFRFHNTLNFVCSIKGPHYILLVVLIV